MITNYIAPRLFCYCGVDQITNIILICRYLISTKCESRYTCIHQLGPLLQLYPVGCEIRTKITCHMIYIHFVTPRFNLWSLTSQAKLCCNNNFWKKMTLHQCCDLVCFDLIKFQCHHNSTCILQVPKIGHCQFPKSTKSIFQN